MQPFRVPLPMTLPLPPDHLHTLATIVFAIALLHTFAARQIDHLGHRFPRHAGTFHLLGEVEVVFGFWAIVLVLLMAVLADGNTALTYAESRDYTEPLFVFVVMVIAGSRPIVEAVFTLVRRLAAWLPGQGDAAIAWLGLAVVPLAGSLVTEPAAMTIAALLLGPVVFRPGLPEWTKYLALGTLFVNVSIGGTLTAYAAPPVLMVASTWQWDSAYLFTHFGWKAAVAVVLSATATTLLLRRHLTPAAPTEASAGDDARPVPWLVTAIHVALLAAVVVLAHHPVAFVGLFLLFLGFTRAYERHQNPLLIKEALLVAFFLAGLVVLGGMQRWWLQPVVASLEPLALFFEIGRAHV